MTPSRYVLCIAVLATCVMSCSLLRPPPHVVLRNYADSSVVTLVYLGYGESVESAKQRLLTSVTAECPRYTIVQEGQGENAEDLRLVEALVGTQASTQTVTAKHPYCWVRYRCGAGQ